MKMAVALPIKERSGPTPALAAARSFSTVSPDFLTSKQLHNNYFTAISKMVDLT